MALPVMSIFEDDQPKLQFYVPILQPLVTKLTKVEELVVEASRARKIRNIRVRMEFRGEIAGEMTTI